MKHILKVVSVVIGLLLFFYLLGVREITHYMKQSFYSNVVVIINTFQYDILEGKYVASDEMKYIMLSEIIPNDMNFNLKKSYIAFKKENNEVVYYLTMVGKGRYFGYNYKNTRYDETMNLSNVKYSLFIDKEKLLKEIKAKKY